MSASPPVAIAPERSFNHHVGSDRIIAALQKIKRNSKGASHICLAARTRSQAEPWERGARLHEQSPPARARLQK